MATVERTLIFQSQNAFLAALNAPFDNSFENTDSMNKRKVLQVNYLNSGKYNALIIFVVVREGSQTVHGSQPVPRKQIIESFHQQILSYQLSAMIWRHWRGRS